VLREIASVGNDERRGTSIRAHTCHRFANRVHAVIVARAAEEGQAAGQREGAATAPVEPQAVAGAEHRDREAAVEIEMRHCVDGGVARVEHALEHEFLRE